MKEEGRWREAGIVKQEPVEAYEYSEAENLARYPWASFDSQYCSSMSGDSSPGVMPRPAVDTLHPPHEVSSSPEVKLESLERRSPGRAAAARYEYSRQPSSHDAPTPGEPVPAEKIIQQLRKAARDDARAERLSCRAHLQGVLARVEMLEAQGAHTIKTLTDALAEATAAHDAAIIRAHKDVKEAKVQLATATGAHTRAREDYLQARLAAKAATLLAPGGNSAVPAGEEGSFDVRIDLNRGGGSGGGRGLRDLGGSDCGGGGGYRGLGGLHFLGGRDCGGGGGEASGRKHRQHHDGGGYRGVGGFRGSAEFDSTDSDGGGVGRKRRQRDDAVEFCGNVDVHGWDDREGDGGERCKRRRQDKPRRRCENRKGEVSCLTAYLLQKASGHVFGDGEEEKVCKCDD